MKKSVRDILLDAFHAIQKEHGLTLNNVQFNIVHHGTCENDAYSVRDIDIEAKALMVNDN